MKKLITILLAAVMLFSAAAPAFADSASTIRLQKTEGTVTVTNASAKALTVRSDIRLYGLCLSACVRDRYGTRGHIPFEFKRRFLYLQFCHIVYKQLQQKYPPFGGYYCWSCWADSNCRPHPYQGCALPTELQQHTCPLTGRGKMCGDRDGARTHDL